MTPEPVLRRLTFIRYVFRTAESISYAAEPMSSASLLFFHDSLELFLQLACEHLNAGGQGTKKPGFLDYFTVINRALAPKSLGHAETMKRLNKARVGLKHDGIIPSKPDIEGFRVSTTIFFRENTPALFGLQFDDLSLAALIEDEKCRDYYRQAEEALTAGLLDDSLTKAAIAFAFLCSRHGIDHAGTGRLSQKAHDYEFRKLGNRTPNQSVLYEIAAAVDALLAEASLARFGIDSKRLSIFRAITPSVWITRDDNVRHLGPRRRSNPPSPEEVRFACEFVFESAVQVQEALRACSDLSIPRHLLSVGFFPT